MTDQRDDLEKELAEIRSSRNLVTDKESGAFLDSLFSEKDENTENAAFEVHPGGVSSKWLHPFTLAAAVLLIGIGVAFVFLGRNNTSKSKNQTTFGNINHGKLALRHVYPSGSGNRALAVIQENGKGQFLICAENDKFNRACVRKIETSGITLAESGQKAKHLKIDPVEDFLYTFSDEIPHLYEAWKNDRLTEDLLQQLGDMARSCDAGGIALLNTAIRTAPASSLSEFGSVILTAGRKPGVIEQLIDIATDPAQIHRQNVIKEFGKIQTPAVMITLKRIALDASDSAREIAIESIIQHDRIENLAFLKQFAIAPELSPQIKNRLERCIRKFEEE